jgi:hypothetical protein
LGAAEAAVIYDSIPDPLPGNVPSLGYQATSTSEFGDCVAFAGTERSLTSVNVTMSDWAKLSDYPAMDPAGFVHPLTLSLYNASPTCSLGSLIASQTINANIPWRPEPFNFNGIAFNVSFNFSGVVVPNIIIFGLSYNTQTWGHNPIGAPGPYNSLNFGVAQVPPTVGTDVHNDSVFWYTSFAPFLTTGIVNQFSEDSAWTPYTPAIQFNAVEAPEPASLALVGAGLLGAGWQIRRARSKRT